MVYHVSISTWSLDNYREFDLLKEEVDNRIIKPYVKDEVLIVGNKWVNSIDIMDIKIFETNELHKYFQ
jgi:hypothetical protein